MKNQENKALIDARVDLQEFCKGCHYFSEQENILWADNVPVAIIITCSNMGHCKRTFELGKLAEEE